MPALVLSAYETASVASRPPAPVAFAEHGVCGEPVYVKGPAAQLTSTFEGAFSIVKVFELLSPRWFASPP